MNRLFQLQLIAHMAIIPMFYFGSLRDFVVSLLVCFLTGCWGMSITYHRLISHRSFRTNRLLKNFGIFLGTIGLTGSALAWCSVHREHHAEVDSPEDPHSPIHKSCLWVQFASMFYRPKMKYLKSLMKDKDLVFFHRHYFKINFIWALFLFFIDPFLVISAYLFPAFLLWHSGSLINVIGHIWGYRNFDTNDQSRNNPLLAIFMWGEGWHNNHHRYPNKSNFGIKWFELDVSYLFIRIIESKPK